MSRPGRPLRRAALAALLSAPGALRAAPPTIPEVWARETWTAEKLPKDVPEDLPKTRIVLHHTASFVSEEQKSLDEKESWKAAKGHARAAQQLHKHIRGWKDVGYHYMIDWRGRILEGRPVDRLGAHTEKRNTGSIGVVLMGNLSRQRATDAQIASLRTLLNWLMYKHEIKPDQITGHYQMKHTTCPGTYLNNVWKKDESAVSFVQIGGAPRPRGRPGTRK